MPISAQQYERLKAKLAESGDKLSPEVMAKAQAALQEFDDAFMGKAAQQIQLPETVDQAKIDAIKAKIIPDVPLQPQVLALQPATGHPKGDEAAKDEWVRGDLSNPNGTVVVYDAPAAKVREKILNQPELLKALGYDMPLSPEAVMAIKPGDSVYEAYNDHEWRRVADEAVKAGKTPYRQSKAPWLREGKGAEVLNSLTTKLKSTFGPEGPALAGARAFIMGVDETGYFGAGTSARESGAAEAPLRQAEAKYGLPGPPSTAPTAKEEDDILREEHPVAHAAGQVAGIVPGLVGGAVGLAGKGVGKVAGAVSTAAGEAAETAGSGIKGLVEWNPANALWDWIAGTGAVAGQAPGMLRGVSNGAAAAGVNQVASAGTRAAQNLAATGETGTNLKDAAMDTLKATGLGGLGALPGVALGKASSLHGKDVREGPRYGRIPERLENLGIEPEFGYGFRDPAPVAEVRRIAAARPGGGVSPVDVYAERLEKPIAEAAKGATKETKLRVGEENKAVYSTPEGRQLLPAQNLAETLVKKLRERTASIDGNNPTPVGTPNADNPIRGIFNANIGGVSLSPSKGAIPIDVGEASSWLNPVWRRRTLRALDEKKAVGRPGQQRAASPAAEEGSALASTGGAPDELATRPRRQGSGRPELESGNSELAQRTADDLATTPKAIARTPRYEPGRKQLGGSNIDKAAPDAAVRGSRAPTAGEKAGSPTPPGPKVTVQHEAAQPRRTASEAEFTANPPEGARWRRRKAHDHKEKAEAAKAPSKQQMEPQTFEASLKARGIKTVYVQPRKYNAQHHESAIRQLRRKGQDTINDRDLGDIHNAALRDRDARSLDGVPGGWSKMQQGHARDIGQTKETGRRVGADKTPDGVYDKVVSVAKQQPGQSKDLGAMQAMAERAGVADDLRHARSLDPLEGIVSRMNQSREGQSRHPLSPVRLYDQSNIRFGYPTSRYITKETNLAGGSSAKLTRYGEGNAEAKERIRERDEARAPGYEAKTKDTKATSGKKVRVRHTETKTRQRRSEE